MRVHSASKRWAVVPLLLGIGAVMALSSPGVAAEGASLADRYPLRLADVDNVSQVVVLNANADPLAVTIENAPPTTTKAKKADPDATVKPKTTTKAKHHTTTSHTKTTTHVAHTTTPKPRTSPCSQTRSESRTTERPSTTEAATPVTTITAPNTHNNAPTPQPAPTVAPTPAAVSAPSTPSPSTPSPASSNATPDVVPSAPTPTIVAVNNTIPINTPQPSVTPSGLVPSVTPITAAPSVSASIAATNLTVSVTATIANATILSPSPSPIPTPTPATTTTAAATTMTITTTTAAAATSATTTHHSHTKTTTPWLPSTIVSISPPQSTTPPTPGTSLPDVVVPNLDPQIPDNSLNVHMRYEHVSYYQVINNGVLAAQLVSFIPAQLGDELAVDPSLILVLAIRDGSTGSGRQQQSRKTKKRGLVTTDSMTDAILVTVAIPKNQYWALNKLVANKTSSLYTPDSNTFGQYLDSTFPLSNNPPSQDGSDDGSSSSSDDGGDSTADPLTGAVSGTVTTGGGSSLNSAIIGSVVGLATAAYVGIAMLVVRKYRRRKLREQEEKDALQRSISEPISVEGGSYGWGWHSS